MAVDNKFLKYNMPLTGSIALKLAPTLCTLLIYFLQRPLFRLCNNLIETFNLFKDYKNCLIVENLQLYDLCLLEVISHYLNSTTKHFWKEIGKF